MSTDPREKADAALSAVDAERKLSPEERKAILAEKIQKNVVNGARVESQSDFQAVLVQGHRPSHLLHFFIGIFTFGIWWIVGWLPIALFGGEKRALLVVDEYGKATVRNGV